MKQKILKYSLLFAAMLIFSRATVFVSPFGVGFFLSLVMLGLNPLVLSPMLVASELLRSFDLGTAIASLVCAAVSIVFYLCNRKFKLNKYFVLFAALSLAGYLGVMVAGSRSAVDVLLTAFFALVFMYVGYTFLSPVLISKLKYKLLDSELISGGIMLIVLGISLAGIDLWGFSPLGLFAVLAAALMGYIFGPAPALVSGMCLGLGAAIYTYDVTMLAAVTFIALVIVIFIPAPRILSGLAGVLGYLMFAFFFNVTVDDSLMWLISVGTGALVFMLLPKKLLKRAVNFFGAPKSRTALRFMVNRNRRDMGNDLLKVSEVFLEMSGIMTGAAVSGAHIRQLAGELVNSVCVKCPNKNKCEAKNVFLEFDELIVSSLNKQRTSILNASPRLADNCVNLAGILTAADTIAARYENLKKKNDSLNMAKQIVSGQLKGMADILKEMAATESLPLVYEEDKEKAIVEELTYRGVVCSEAWVRADGELTLVVLTSSLDTKKIERVLKRLFKSGFNIETEESVMHGWSVVRAVKAPRYDVVFGACNSCKIKGSCGDTHSFIKLTADKFMMALCDGMGSGTEAQEFSTVTLSLIENFYRAGFEHDLVLDSVNKFLTLSGEETYSAVDVIVIDLSSGVADIIKIGSPPTYIKNNEKLVRIDGSSLPMGVLDEMSPFVRSVRLKAGDTVLLASDGISDAFNGDDLANLINGASGLPKELCKTVLETAVKQFTAHGDDMTVTALRLFERAA